MVCRSDAFVLYGKFLCAVGDAAFYMKLGGKRKKSE